MISSYCVIILSLLGGEIERGHASFYWTYLLYNGFRTENWRFPAPPFPTATQFFITLWYILFVQSFGKRMTPKHQKLALRCAGYIPTVHQDVTQPSIAWHPTQPSFAWHLVGTWREFLKAKTWNKNSFILIYNEYILRNLFQIQTHN